MLLAALLACSPPAPLTQEVYVWQRVWTPEVRAAVDAAAGTVSGWRVLAAELDRHGAWREAGPDLPRLAATDKPVVMVIRIEGQLVRWDEGKLRGAILGLLSRWRGQGLAVAAVEIDHDCATARLPDYAAFLGALQAALPDGVRLSLTALPAWLDSPALDAVLARVDEAVLQVHAVADPRDGLFDAARARTWMRAFGRRMDKPWRVALPAYGSRVAWDETGRIAAIDSERPSLVAGRASRELVAPPEEMAAFVAGLDRDRPARLAGIAWFRLPTDEDARAWSLATWLAVAGGTPLRPHMAVVARSTGHPGLYDLVLRSDGATDAVLPARVRIGPVCPLADGINGYALEREPDGLALVGGSGGLLRAGRERAIGWARCQAQPSPRVE
jgi:hypothetical protein